MLCCCFRFRIPRTKQEIEADYQRRKIAKKFRQRLEGIKNSEMDDMNLQKGPLFVDTQLTFNNYTLQIYSLYVFHSKQHSKESDRIF